MHLSSIKSFSKTNNSRSSFLYQSAGKDSFCLLKLIFSKHSSAKMCELNEDESFTLLIIKGDALLFLGVSVKSRLFLSIFYWVEIRI